MPIEARAEYHPPVVAETAEGPAAAAVPLPGAGWTAGSAQDAGPVGVLLVNLGTPDAPDAAAVRRYLAEFLADPRVIELPRLLWRPILHGLVLRTRPRRSAALYARIWDRERGESPLRTTTRAQAAKLGAALGRGVVVDWAMRYGTPAIADRLDALQVAGCERIVIFPLYPQYAAAATASVSDRVYAHLATKRRQPALRTVPAYPAEPGYIEAVAASIEAHLASLDDEPEIVVASFHGLPEATRAKGDPYFDHCHRTAALLRARLGWEERRLPVTFQSRFMNMRWLQPHTIETVAALARSGVRRIAVVTPGFVADCLETLEEIARANGEAFRAAGGEHFSVVPCLNDSPAGIAVLETVVRRELAGWIPPGA